MAGKIDVLVIPQQDLNRVQDTLDAPDVQLMSVAQAEAIAQTIPELKHVVLWRGLLDLSRDIPNSNVDKVSEPYSIAVAPDWSAHHAGLKEVASEPVLRPRMCLGRAFAECPVP